jgi:CBS domain containing-hemolysin-like protein
VLVPEVKTIETVGGYMLARLGHPPEGGERVECEGYTLVATDVAGRRVRRVRIVPADVPTEGAKPETQGEGSGTPVPPA